MITFEPFKIWHLKQKKRKGDLYVECGFSPTTVAKIWKDDGDTDFRLSIVDRICSVYKLKVEDVIKYKEDEE